MPTYVLIGIGQLVCPLTAYNTKDKRKVSRGGATTLAVSDF